jgi:hypothetical protein
MRACMGYKRLEALIWGDILSGLTKTPLLESFHLQTNLDIAASMDENLSKDWQLLLHIIFYGNKHIMINWLAKRFSFDYP